MVKKVIIISLFLSLCGLESKAATHTNLEARLNKHEKQLKALERHAFSSKKARVSLEESPLDQAADLQDLQEQMRQMRGQIEELEHKIRVQDETLERFKRDADFRFQEIEKGSTPLKAPPQAGTLEAPAGIAPTSQDLPSGEPLELYEKGRLYLTQANYTEALKTFESFLKQYPKHDLAANAQYWLGETYYGLKDYAVAAGQFAKGYQTHPKHAKAPDNLLKLALSLSQLKKKGEACQTLAKLKQEFPNLTPAQKMLAENARKENRCS